MTRHVLLVRGINVGGRRLPMAELRALLSEFGAQRIETYIQSGNAVFEVGGAVADEIAKGLPAAIGARHGFAPRVIVLNARDLARFAADNPFPDCTDDPKTLHLFFLEGAPAEDADQRLNALAAPSERVRLADRVVYLCAPDGIARSKLVSGIERALGTPATGRNWRTVTTLLDMAGHRP